MSDQKPLFSFYLVGADRDHALARFTDPVTSFVASARLSEREGSPVEIRRNTHRHRALTCFQQRSMTADEVRLATGVDGIWKRVSDLKNLNLIRATGHTRRSRQGREQEVYEITDAGLEALERLR